MTQTVWRRRPFVAEIVRVKRRPAGAVVTATVLTPIVTTPKTAFLKSAVETHADRVIHAMAGRLKFENVSGTLPQRAHSARRYCRIVRPRQRRVDVYRAQGVQQVGVIIGRRDFQIVGKLML